MTSATIRCQMALAVLVIVMMCCASGAFAQAGIVARALGAGARELIDALEGFAARTSTRTLAEELAEAGGEAAVESFSARLASEGGEVALARAARLVQRVGPEAITTLTKTAQPAALLEALDGLPANVADTALRALGRGTEGEALAAAATQYGGNVLKVEGQFPGLGVRLAHDLGEDGIAIAQQLSAKDARVLAHHSTEIARLPEALKGPLLTGALKHLGNFVDFLEKHPNFAFTTAATAVLLEEGDQIFGSSQIATDAKGNPVMLARPGFIERFFEVFIAGIATSILAPVGLMLAILIGSWGAIKLWFLYRRHRSNERSV